MPYAYYYGKLLQRYSFIPELSTPHFSWHNLSLWPYKGLIEPLKATYKDVASRVRPETKPCLRPSCHMLLSYRNTFTVLVEQHVGMKGAVMPYFSYYQRNLHFWDISSRLRSVEHNKAMVKKAWSCRLLRSSTTVLLCKKVNPFLT